MTESQWLTSRRPGLMLNFICRKSTHRKTRLYAAACVRRVIDPSDERSKRAVDLSEQFADRRIPYGRLKDLFPPDEMLTHPEQAARWCTRFGKVNEPQMATALALDILYETDEEAAAKEAVVQAALARDIFGNPFQPKLFNRRWRSTNAVEIARTIYEDRAFDRMPILADALMDAGCEEPRIIEHCKGPGPHVRGCWVVDLVLGKE